MATERNNHDWSRNDSGRRRENRRDDRYSRDKRNHQSDGEPFKQQNRRENSDKSKSSNYGRRFDRNGNSKRYGKDSTQPYQKRQRAFEQYQSENQPGRRPRVQYGENGERLFREKRAATPAQVQPQQADKAVRLNKYIANAGICSRREADVLITTGVIKVNGEVVTTLGYRVQPGDKVQYNGRTLRNEKKVYILLNKPKGYITTSDDPHQRKTVMELIDGACRERVYPVGRLDRMTTGLLLLTNDGELTKKLTHPSYGAQKVYNAELDRPLLKEDMNKLLEGVELEDGMMRVDDINWQNNTPMDKKKVGISIHSGKNRIIRRLFEYLGYEVKKLDRVYFAGLTKKNLLRGQYRFLEDKEIGFLYMQK
ncbi:MAG: rRNA pseudouridine synthase [Bacteroidales bacterium]|nr:rRNA pseudouridine synthase [Bacteroidales bacterium]MBP3254774.1 rRNA pseudouridine synthase [Bacteroidales bacterium]